MKHGGLLLSRDSREISSPAHQPVGRGELKHPRVLSYFRLERLVALARRLSSRRNFPSDLFLGRLRQEVRDGGGAEGPGERRYRERDVL